MESILSSFFHASSIYLSVVELRADDVAFVLPNQRMAQLYGLTASELAGKTLRELGFPEDTVRSWIDHLRQCRDKGSTVTFEHPFPPGAEDRWLECSLIPIQDASFGFSAVEITKWKQAEAERALLLAQVQELNERLAASNIREQEVKEQSDQQAIELTTLLQSIPQAVSVFDATGKVILHNDAAVDLACVNGHPAHSLAECEPIQLLRIDGTPLPREEWPVDRLLKGHDIIEEEYIVERADGSRRRMVATGRAVLDDGGKVRLAIIVSQDVTKLREAERNREDFVHMVSHDLRTPLTAVYGYAQLLERALERAGANERQMQSVEAILVGIRRMDAMIQDLVDSARLETRQLRLEIQPVAFGPFLRDLLLRSRQALQTSRIDAQLPGDLPAILADPNRLERILTNLLSNALKYSPPETRVRVEATAVSGRVEVAVQDQGVGIAPEEIPHIFDRFYRTRSSANRRVDGLGLGLYITRMLVEAHNGRIWVESQPGKGSTFYFSLPIAGSGSP